MPVEVTVADEHFWEILRWAPLSYGSGISFGYAGRIKYWLLKEDITPQDSFFCLDFDCSCLKQYGLPDKGMTTGLDFFFICPTQCSTLSMSSYPVDLRAR